ncbi:hypothetical protein CPY51_00275 [Rhizobium tubonense]|uniref:Uncharacterized protein n=1 Tax=Rhizobium tubonense TaxID=484088 RepID=A0A2W4CZF1_9HYPH|nr:hypothetical protein CPY51_00275 [Rhizobium tubonense]
MLLFVHSAWLSATAPGEIANGLWKFRRHGIEHDITSLWTREANAGADMKSIRDRRLKNRKNIKAASVAARCL